MIGPFALVPVEVFMDDRLTKIEIRVLGAILTFRDKTTNLSRPTRGQISERCGYGARTVSKATSTLVEKGWLSKAGRGGAGQATTYRFTVPEIAGTLFEPDTVSGDETLSSSGTVSDGETLSGSGTVPESGTVPGSGTKPCPNRCKNPVRTGHTNRPSPTNQTKREGPRRRATRLTLTELPDEWRTFCRAERPDLDPDRTFAGFRDYWVAKPGKDGTKLDWLATWRNWVRRERQGAPPDQPKKGNVARAMEALGYDPAAHETRGTGNGAGASPAPRPLSDQRRPWWERQRHGG